MNYYTQFYLNKLANFGLQSPEPIPSAPKQESPSLAGGSVGATAGFNYKPAPISAPTSNPFKTFFDKFRSKPFLPKEITDQQGKNSQKFITDGSATSRQVLQNAYPTTPLQPIIDSARKYREENEELTKGIREKLDDKTLDEKVRIKHMKPTVKGDPDFNTYGSYSRWGGDDGIKPESLIKIKPDMTPQESTANLGHEFTHKLQSRPASKGWPTDPVTGKLLSTSELSSKRLDHLLL